MEVSSSLQHHLGDSFSYGWLTQAQPPSFAADAGQAFGSSRSSYIDMDPADLFSMRWTTAAPPGSDFDFGLPVPGDGGDASPAQLVSASQIFRGGRLLPCEPGACSGVAQQDVHGDAGDDYVTRGALDAVAGAARWSAPSSPLFHSAQSTPLSLSACSSTMSNHGRARPVRRGSSPWKVLLRYVRFLMPLYRKARALAPPSPRRKHARVAPAAGSPGRVSTTSSVDWCHGSADTAVRDAILYCKKSSVSATEKSCIHSLYHSHVFVLINTFNLISISGTRCTAMTEVNRRSST
jgi:hypothetical protein